MKIIMLSVKESPSAEVVLVVDGVKDNIPN